MTLPVSESPASGDQKPRRWDARHALARPAFETRGECVGEGVFRFSHVTAARREIGQQSAITLACGALRGVVRAIHIGKTGRTSIVPWLAPGHRAAH